MADIVDIGSESEAAPSGADSEKLLRLQADFENFRRRNATARAEAASEARRDLLGQLLGVYDNLLRARDHAAEASPDVLPYLEGFDAIRSQLEQFLRAHGLEEIPAQPGELFDPEIHEATAMLPAPGDEADGAIAELLRKGFTFKGTVVRPASVLVYQARQGAE